MKKIIYAALLALIVSISFYSCTEEQVTPNQPLNGGGAVEDPIKR